MPNMLETVERIANEVETLKLIEGKLKADNEHNIDTTALTDYIANKEKLLSRP